MPNPSHRDGENGSGGNPDSLGVPGGGSGTSTASVPDLPETSSGTPAAGRGAGRRRAGSSPAAEGSPLREGFDILKVLQEARTISIPADETFAARYPQTYKLMTIREGLSHDGRNGTSITVVSEGASYGVIITAKGCGLQKTLPLASLMDFWGQIELALHDQTIPWREQRGWKQKKEEAKKPEKA